MNTDQEKPTALKDLPAGTFKTVRKIDQGGALQARKLNYGTVQFYWRYTHEGKTERVPIGTYDSSAPPKSLSPTPKGYSINAAAEVCRTHALTHQQHQLVGGFREHREKTKLDHKQKTAKAEKAKEQTLEKLLWCYCDYLEAQGRRSHMDARSIFQLHVVDKFPALANTQANQVLTASITDALRALIDANKGRTANKLRSYMRAAYQCAMDVDHLATIPASFKKFDVTSNPAATTKRNASFDCADKNPLTAKQLAEYRRMLFSNDTYKAHALRLHLLTGGQRIQQLVRLKKADVDDTRITIFDIKGRPGQGPRAHTIPLIDEARMSLAVLMQECQGPFVLSTDGGKTPINATTLSNWASEIAGAKIPDFQLKRIRSGIETMLSSNGVSREVRGLLQSHGVSGVQAKHYDAYDYQKEKLLALEILERALCTSTIEKC